MDLGKFERAIGFFMRALEMNEFNFAALANIVYCNQKLYNWQDYDHFHALLEHGKRTLVVMSARCLPPLCVCVCSLPSSA